MAFRGTPPRTPPLGDSPLPSPPVVNVRPGNLFSANPPPPGTPPSTPPSRRLRRVPHNLDHTNRLMSAEGDVPPLRDTAWPPRPTTWPPELYPYRFGLPGTTPATNDEASSHSSSPTPNYTSDTAENDPLYHEFLILLEDHPIITAEHVRIVDGINGDPDFRAHKYSAADGFKYKLLASEMYDWLKPKIHPDHIETMVLHVDAGIRDYYITVTITIGLTRHHFFSHISKSREG